MSKHPQQQQPKPHRHLLRDLDAKPVTSKDKWCYKPSIIDGKPATEGDWGYIVTLPSFSKGNRTILDGIKGFCIVRTKKFCDQYLLQIVPTRYDKQYGIDSQKKELYPHIMSGRGKRRKNQHIWNVRNLQKGN